jgi:hypothetical protein
MFGTIEESEAVQNATIILRGLKLEDYVQKDARRMLRAMTFLRSAVASFRPVVEDISRHTALFEQGAMPDEQSWNGLMAVWEEKGDEADRRYKHAERWQRRYNRRLEIAAVVARFWHLPYEGQAVVAQIRPQVEQVLGEYKQMVDEYRVVLARLEQALRQAGLLQESRAR